MPGVVPHYPRRSTGQTWAAGPAVPSPFSPLRAARGPRCDSRNYSSTVGAVQTAAALFFRGAAGVCFPWPVIAGGIPVIITTLGFTFLGESLRDVFDPKLRKEM